jgi:hypothetical protein
VIRQGGPMAALPKQESGDKRSAGGVHGLRAEATNR